MLQQIESVFFDGILFLYAAFGNLGLAIIALTLLIRFILLPITQSSMKSAQKIKELQPEVDKLKKKHGKDQQALQKAQLELYKKYNVNPFAGCLPQIIQLVVLLFLYRMFISFLGQTEVHGVTIDPTFAWLNLGQPDSLHILPFLAFATQMVLSLMIAPGGEVRDVVPNKSRKQAIKKENEKEENMAEMAATMQKQMLFIMPVMTGVIALQFPAGLALYWIVGNIFSIVQQYYLSGWGGLVSYSQRALSFITQKK